MKCAPKMYRDSTRNRHVRICITWVYKSLPSADLLEQFVCTVSHVQLYISYYAERVATRMEGGVPCTMSLRRCKTHTAASASILGPRAATFLNLTFTGTTIATLGAHHGK